MRIARRPTRLLVALAATVALVAAGCSAEGGSDAGSTTTAAPPTTDGGTATTGDDGSTTTTTDDEATTTTTTAGGGGAAGDGPTDEELEALLPAPADLGVGWTVAEDEDEDDDDATESDAFDDQCPDVGELQLGDDDENDDDDVVGAYEDAEGRQVEVTLSSGAESIDDAELEAFVDAINECGTITDTDDTTGMTSEFAFEARLDDTYGEQGIRLQVDVTVSGGALPTDVTVVLYGFIWREGPVSVEVSGTDGIDDAFEAVPFDTDLLVQVAEDLDVAVADLVG